MIHKLTYYSKVVDGKLQGNVSKFIKEELPRFNDKRVEVTIKQISSKRSDQQNRYIHLLFTIFKDSLNDLGNDFSMQEVKDLCKFKFAKTDVINTNTGELLGERIKGTSEMGKLELAEFVDNVIDWAKEMFNIRLPKPGEQLEI